MQTRFVGCRCHSPDQSTYGLYVCFPFFVMGGVVASNTRTYPGFSVGCYLVFCCFGIRVCFGICEVVRICIFVLSYFCVLVFVCLYACIVSCFHGVLVSISFILQCYCLLVLWMFCFVCLFGCVVSRSISRVYTLHNTTLLYRSPGWGYAKITRVTKILARHLR